MWRWVRRCRTLFGSQRSFSVSDASHLHSFRSTDTRRNTRRWWAWGQRSGLRPQCIWGTPPRSRPTVGGKKVYVSVSRHLPFVSFFFFSVLFHVKCTCSKRTTFSGCRQEKQMRRGHIRRVHQGSKITKTIRYDCSSWTQRTFLHSSILIPPMFCWMTLTIRSGGEKRHSRHF